MRIHEEILPRCLTKYWPSWTRTPSVNSRATRTGSERKGHFESSLHYRAK